MIDLIFRLWEVLINQLEELFYGVLLDTPLFEILYIDDLVILEVPT